jgi:adenine phosphoribosyltransferase
MSSKETLDPRLAALRDRIRTIPNFPKPGIQYRDITTLWNDPQGFRLCNDMMAERYASMNIDRVIGIESRGFILGAALADRLGKGFVPIRKQGKLPAEVERYEYQLEYGTDVVEIHKDALVEGQRVLLVDDLLATGGTLEAALQLVRRVGGVAIEAATIVELPALGGRKRLEALGLPVFCLLGFEGD